MGFSAGNYNLAPHGHLEANGHQIIGTGITYPGVRGTLKESITTSDGTVLKAGSSVIIQPLNHNQANQTPKFIITPYQNNIEKTRDDQPESHRDIVFAASHEVTLSEPESVLNFNNEHFRRSGEALFPSANSPSWDEINQGRIPDCFLLAAIQAILNHPNGKSFIRGMMRGNGDGTTTVRLFDPVTLQPEYIRVENSVIIDGFSELNLHSALWIHILEKAFAARGKRNETTVPAAVSSVYSEGGIVHLALQSLTGLKAEDFNTAPAFKPEKIESFLGADTFNVIKLLIQENVPEQQIVNCLNVSLNQKQFSAIYHLFYTDVGNSEGKTKALNDYVAILKCYVTDPDLYNSAWKSHSVNNLRHQHPDAAEALDSIFTKDTPFSGYYNKNQDEIFTKVKTGLSQGKLVTASTASEFDKKVTGLVGNHAYTVLGIVERPLRVKDKDGNEKNINARFVKVRNPWGDLDGLMDVARQLGVGAIARVYEQHKSDLDIRVAKSNKATFLMELNEFCQYFSHYDITETASGKFARDAQKEQCIADITHLAATKIDFTSSNQELVLANEEYSKQVNNLVKFELLELNKIDANTITAVNDIFDQGYERSIEEKSINGLIDENLFPNISGSVDEVKSHIYAALKLKWLRAQNQRDTAKEQEVIDSLQKNSAQPELWTMLERFKFTINLIVMSRANSQTKAVENMIDLHEILKEDAKQLKALLAAQEHTDRAIIDGMMEKLIANFIAFESLYHQYLNLDIVVKHFHNSNGEDDRLAKFASVVEDYNKLIQPIVTIKPYLNDLWTLRYEIRNAAADMAKKHEISEGELKDIELATNCMFSGKLKPIGDTLLHSTSQERRNLGIKIIKADTLVKKIQEALLGIKCFFAKVVTHASTFFHLQNKYELQPVPKPVCVR